MTKTIISVLALGFATTAGTAPTAAPEPLIRAVHPHLPPTEIIARLRPRAAGRSVVVGVGRSNGQYVEAIGRNNGDYDAGAIRGKFYNEFVSRSLRVLVRLPEVSIHLFVTRSGLPANQVTVLRRALPHLQNVPDAAAMLRAIGRDMTAMAPMADADYDGMRKALRVLEDRSS